MNTDNKKIINAVRRFKQGRLSLTKLKALVHRFVREEESAKSHSGHVHGENCNHDTVEIDNDTTQPDNQTLLTETTPRSTTNDIDQEGFATDDSAATATAE
jgi:hypothetical protein